MKGVSTVIVVILLVLLTVGAVSLFFFWGVAFQSDVSGESGLQIEKYSDETGMLLNIESISQCKVFVRNRGTTTVPAGTVNILVDGRSVSFDSTLEEIRPDQQATFTITQNISCQKEMCVLRIVSAGEQSARVEAVDLQCPA